MEGAVPLHLDLKLQKPIMKFNVRLEDDGDQCNIFGCCLVSGKRLVIADVKNKNLKLLNPLDNKTTKLCDTEKDPLRLFSFDPIKVAVVLRDRVHRLYHIENMTWIDMPLGDITCIAFDGSLLFTGYKADVCVFDRYDENRQLPTISNDTVRKNVFYDIQKIGVNGDRLYVVDYVGGLVCMKKNGELIFHCSPEKLGIEGATGVAIGKSGYVFVCGCRSSNVVEVKEEGLVVRQLLSQEDGIMYPRCLAYDDMYKRLYVGGADDQIIMCMPYPDL